MHGLFHIMNLNKVDFFRFECPYLRIEVYTAVRGLKLLGKQLKYFIVLAMLEGLTLKYRK